MYKYIKRYIKLIIIILTNFVYSVIYGTCDVSGGSVDHNKQYTMVCASCCIVPTGSWHTCQTETCTPAPIRGGIDTEAVIKLH